MKEAIRECKEEGRYRGVMGVPHSSQSMAPSIDPVARKKKPSYNEGMPTPEQILAENPKVNPVPEIKDSQEVVDGSERQESAVETATETRESNKTKEEDRELNPTEALPRIEAALKRNQTEIDQVKASLAGDREKLAAIRESLGLPPNEDEPVATKGRLDDLLTEQKRLEGEQKENEAVEDLNKILEQLNELPKDEIKIIIETGKRKDGSELEGKNGKVNPDVAKELGKLAEKGVKKITEAILKSVLAIVKGVLLGIFRGIKGSIAENETES